MSRRKHDGKKDETQPESSKPDDFADLNPAEGESGGSTAEASESAPPPEVLVPPAPEEEDTTRKTSITSRIASAFTSAFGGDQDEEKTKAGTPTALAAAEDGEQPAAAEEEAPPKPKRAPFNGEIVSEPSADGYVWIRIRGSYIRKMHARGDCRRLGTDGPDGPYITCEIPVSGLE